MKKGQLGRTVITAVGLIGIGIAAAAIFFFTKNSKAEEMEYREAAAEYRTLTVGMTKTAPISFGVAEQTFDLDIGAWTGDDSAALQIEEVLVRAGQQVQKGTALFRVTPDSVQNIRSLLQKRIFETDRDCEVLEARQKEIQLLASQGYDSDVIDGKYAGVIYDNRYNELQKRAENAKEAVDEKQNQVNENLLKAAQAQQELVQAQKYLREAEAAVLENYDSRYKNAYYYSTYENTRETAQNMVNQLEEQIESLARKNESLLYEVDEAVRTYHQIIQELEKEKLTVKKDYDTKLYGSSMASEWYDIQTINLDRDLQEARDRYLAALQNIRLWNACLVNNQVRSQYNGVLNDIVTNAGDTINKNDILVTLYDQEAVTMEVSLHEEEYLAVNQEETVHISFDDNPDKVYEGRITEIYNANGGDESENRYDMVTVTIQGDVTDLYEGMSGDVTFLTKEAREVLSVLKEAVFREGKRTYVKMRDQKGNVVEKNVITGFSDGIYVEIRKGISEGDVVLIEQ